ncbi:hypothetical protein Vadar_025284 [Vaccinium darrowii]|uniref:Uncharacterized protein n=1 Tax=Vaccinium darrowii TaxID=229202 RepID=A0ACB7X4D3_9ERIC|nr:hypothetical protein Vadar_025284 [Vaccinium darrowii]
MAAPLTGLQHRDGGGGRVAVMAGPVNQSNNNNKASKCVKNSALRSPILIFLYFHKAIQTELDGLHRATVAFANNQESDDMNLLLRQCHFLRSIYKHHCSAEDEVIFIALDIRVKNVARTYSLEHEGESILFDQLFALQNSNVQTEENSRIELASCSGALQTSISQHMSKEEEQVFPLLIEKFLFEEQASLVWQFLCSIPGYDTLVGEREGLLSGGQTHDAPAPILILDEATSALDTVTKRLVQDALNHLMKGNNCLHSSDVDIPRYQHCCKLKVVRMQLKFHVFSLVT